MSEIFIIGGPNGAGKTCAAKALFPEVQCQEYINADNIAADLSSFAPENTAIQAGCLMLERIHRLADQKKDFAFETTMAARSFIPYLKKYKEQGYFIHLIFLWLQNSDLAVERVKYRTATGGHNIPDEIIHRRYHRGIQNFLNLYIPLANDWIIYDNSFNKLFPSIVAQKRPGEMVSVFNEEIWDKINEK